MNTVQKFISDFKKMRTKKVGKTNPLEEQKMFSDLKSLSELTTKYNQVNAFKEKAENLVKEMNIEKANVKEFGNKNLFTYEIWFVRNKIGESKVIEFKIKKRMLVILLMKLVVKHTKEYLDLFLFEMNEYFKKYNR